MNRHDAIMWTGRTLTVLFTVAVLLDIYLDSMLSHEIRRIVISAVDVLFISIAAWQARIAYKYDGPPVLLKHFPFRWVVALTFGAWATFVTWQMILAFMPEWYTERRSAVVWWIFGTATLWFAARWVTVDATSKAGIGETGTGKTT